MKHPVIKKRFISLLILLLPICVLAQNIEYEKSENIFYLDSTLEDITDYQKKMCLLDIYYPKTKDKVPVIIWIHGGGLTSGKKHIPWGLKKKGCIIVAVDYRLAPKVKGEVCISDTASSIAWVFNNIEAYNGDPNLIFVSGASAGGYLALMTVMDKKMLNKHGIDSDRVAGLVPFTGHTITHFTIRKENGIPSKQPIIDEFAPLYYVRKDAPPILLITGDRNLELLGRYEENAYFYRMMKVCGNNDITQYEMAGYGHDMAGPAYRLLLNFVEKIKKQKNNI